MFSLELVPEIKCITARAWVLHAAHCTTYLVYVRSKSGGSTCLFICMYLVDVDVATAHLFLLITNFLGFDTEQKYVKPVAPAGVDWFAFGCEVFVRLKKKQEPYYVVLE